MVSVIVVGEGFGRLREVDLIGRSRDKVFGFFAVRGSLRQRRVSFEIGESTRGGVVEEVAAEIIGAKAEGRVLVDCDHRIRIGFATNRRVAGRGARGVLVEIVCLIGRCLRLALLVVRCRRTAVTDGVVVEVLGEAGDGLAVLRSAGRSQLGAGIVGVAVDGAREVAEGATALGDGNAATGGIVGVVELGNDIGRRGVTNLEELVIRVVGPGGR